MESKCCHHTAPSNGPLYSFSAAFYEGQPSRIYLRYFGITDQGASATVGIEGKTGRVQKLLQFSFNGPLYSSSATFYEDQPATLLRRLRLAEVVSVLVQ